MPNQPDNKLWREDNHHGKLTAHPVFGLAPSTQGSHVEALGHMENIDSQSPELQGLSNGIRYVTQLFREGGALVNGRNGVIDLSKPAYRATFELAASRSKHRANYQAGLLHVNAGNLRDWLKEVPTQEADEILALINTNLVDGNAGVYLFTPALSQHAVVLEDDSSIIYPPNNSKITLDDMKGLFASAGKLVEQKAGDNLTNLRRQVRHAFSLASLGKIAFDEARSATTLDAAMVASRRWTRTGYQ